MSSRAARTRTPSGRAAAAKPTPVKGTPTKAATIKTTTAKAAATKAAAKPATKTSKAAPKPTPTAKPKARGRSAVKKPITPEIVEDEAEEVDEEEAAKEEEDHGEEDNTEERSGVDITSDDDVSYVSVASNNDDEDYQEEIQAVEQAIKKVTTGRKLVARKASTPESPKIRRSLKKGEVPVSQESPSPKKPKNTLTRKPTFAVAPASTPSRKRTKESYSDEDSEEEASPAKKVREETPVSNEDEDVEMVEATPKRNRRGVKMVDKKVQTAPPLPRGNTAAKAAVRGTPRKVKDAKAPNSADAFFNPSDIDRSSDIYRRQSKLFTDALDESAKGDVAHVTEAMQDVHIEENMNEGILDFETPGAMCDLLRESYKSLLVLQPCAIDTGSSIMSSALLYDHIIDGPYDVHPQALEDLVKFSHDGKADDPFVINAARADPTLAKAYQYNNSRAFCLAANVNSPTPPRLICATMVVCLGCHMIEPAQMSTAPVRTIKEFLGVPLRGELERSIAFYGTIFGREVLGVQNFGAGIGEHRQIGLVFRTYPDTPGMKPNPGRSLGGMGASPAMLRKAQTPKRTAAGPARSLLDMRDKTSWSSTENFAIWDAREYFTLDKDEGLQYLHENVASLPRLQQDLEFGDLAIVYHSVSTFDFVRQGGGSSSDKPPAYNEADTVLSMNLYGAALVSKYGSKSV